MIVRLGQDDFVLHLLLDKFYSVSLVDAICSVILMA